jgi:hypothetical protein
MSMSAPLTHFPQPPGLIVASQFTEEIVRWALRLDGVPKRDKHRAIARKRNRHRRIFAKDRTSAKQLSIILRACRYAWYPLGITSTKVIPIMGYENMNVNQCEKL